MWHNIPETNPPPNMQVLLYVRFHAYGTEWYDHVVGWLGATAWYIHYNLDYASFFVIAWHEIEPYQENQ